MKRENIEALSRAWLVAREGALIGVRMTRLYAGAFIVYATVRVAVAVIAHPTPGIPVVRTVGATAASLVVASVAITTLLGIISTIIGAATAIAIHAILRASSSRGQRARPVIVAAIVGLATLVVGQAGVLPAVGFEVLSLPFETYMFWFGIPSALYLVATAWLGNPLWRHARLMHAHESTESHESIHPA